MATGTSFKAIASLPLTGVTVATFTDPGGAEPNFFDPAGTINDHYQIASINWGDGSPLDTTTGTLSYGGPPDSMTSPFTISGSHTYADEGVYTITTVIDHESSTPTTVTSTITVRDNIGLLVLDPSGSGALTVSGNAGITVNNHGAVVVNSTNAAAAILSGTGGVSASDIDVTGGTKVTGGGKFSGPIGHETPTADPIALPLPPAIGPLFPAVNYNGTTTLTLSPGTYVGGIHNKGPGNIVLSPGIYYLQGGGLQVSGNGSLTGNTRAPHRQCPHFPKRHDQPLGTGECRPQRVGGAAPTCQLRGLRGHHAHARSGLDVTGHPLRQRQPDDGRRTLCSKGQARHQRQRKPDRQHRTPPHRWR